VTLRRPRTRAFIGEQRQSHRSQYLYSRGGDGLSWRNLPDPEDLGGARLPNLIYYRGVDKAGDFAAWEEPQLFATEFERRFAPYDRSLALFFRLDITRVDLRMEREQVMPEPVWWRGPRSSQSTNLECCWV